jgi:hypothetical protein
MTTQSRYSKRGIVLKMWSASALSACHKIFGDLDLEVNRLLWRRKRGLGGRRWKGIGAMRNKELRIQDVEASHTLCEPRSTGVAGEGGTQGLKKCRKTNPSFCALKCQKLPCLNLISLPFPSTAVSAVTSPRALQWVITAHVTLQARKSYYIISFENS